MRRLRISGQVIGRCFTCCAAATLMIGLAALGHGLAGRFPHATSAKQNSVNRLLASASPVSGVKSSKLLSVTERFRQFPLSFEPNRQQTSPEVKFLTRGEGYILFLTDHDAVFSLGKAPHASSVMRMSLLGANEKPSFTAMEQLPGKSNYLIGNKPELWHTNIPNYRKVAEHNVYPGIDLVYYGTQSQLEYDFVVAPGSSPSKIQIAFQGAKNIHTDADGNLVLSVAGSADLRLHKPIAYQQVGTEKQLVAANFVLKGKDRVEFGVGNYDPSLPLIVDPILSYSTYLGGSNIDGGNAIAVAPDNTAFISGGTFSTDFPTAHPLQPSHLGPDDFDQDVFVAKISADGSTLLYSTYLGGKFQDVANGIAVDNFGNAYVTGTTLSKDFPVTPGSFNPACGGDGECGATFNPQGDIVANGFLAKLNIAGSGLVYSGFIGSYNYVAGYSVAVDGDGNAYVTGQVGANIPQSLPIPAPPAPPPPNPPPYLITPNAFQPFYGTGSNNAFLVKVSATGSTILYSSYLGGSVEDSGYGIAVDSSANAYITGLTYSQDFPTTPGAFQANFGGAGDAFVAKVATNVSGANGLLYSTYLGGAGLDRGNGIAFDSTGAAYVTGVTNSAAFAFAPNGFQTTFGGEGDAFVAKMTPAGALSYFTYLGGTKADQGTGIAVDSLNNAYVTGTTVSTDFPTSGAIFQPAYGGGNSDSFVSKLDPTGTILVYSSYLGGSNTELATGIAVDTSGSAYVTGQTCSNDFPQANPLQSNPGGNCDAYIAKVTILPGIAINPAGLSFAAQSINTTSPSQTVTIVNGDNPQTISSIVISGANAGDFADSTTCGPSIAIGASCTITVTFTPTGSGIRKASIVITDSAPGSPHVVNLTGNTSNVSLSTSSLAFGLQQVGVASAPQAVTVTNSGTTPLTFSAIAASGDFSETDTCTKTPLQPNTNCVVEVVFRPSAPVASIGAITLTDNGSGSPQMILATGTGVLEPQASLSPASLGFAAEPTGSPSTPETVTLSNTGNASLNIASIVASGDFSQTSTCGAVLPVSSNCVISVTFTPTAAGTRTGALTITDNSGNVVGSTQSVQLTGSGQAVPVASLSTSTLTFAAQSIGAASAAQSVTLTNTGSAPLIISAVTAGGDFSQINTCPTSIAAGANCTISVTFTPTASGNRFGSVTIADNATNSPQTISLSGIGTPTPQASLSAAILGFAGQPISSTSAAQTVTLSNTGDATLNIASIAATGDFAQTSTCGGTLSSGANCAISVAFTPTAAGTRNGTLTITDNSGNVAGNTQTVPLSGTGQAVPIASFSTTTLTFAAQSIGATSAAQPVTLTNSGSAALVISNVTASGDFAQVNTCATSIAVGANCTINVTFTPTASGNRFGSVTIADTAGNSPQTISLSGIGTPTPQAAVSATTLGFTSQAIGSTSPAQTVTLSNTGNAALNIASIVATGDFGESNACGATLAAGANCAISVTFTPTAAGARSGSVTITDNSGNVSGTAQNVVLSGTGQAVPGASLSATTLTFAGQSIGTTSAAQPVTLTNTGTAALVLSNVAASGDFAQVNNCPTSIAAGATCTINVTFTPTASGNRFGSVTITDNAAGSPQSITLSGIGNPTPQASVSVPSLGFANQSIGSTSAAQTVTLTNSGAASLSVTSIIAAGDFSETNTCGSILSASTSCTINVTFTPTAAGPRIGSLTITDNTGGIAGSTQAVALTGTGQAVPVVSLSTSTLTFVVQSIGATSAAQPVTLTNTGSAALVITSVAASGDFAQANTCPASLAAGANCTINVTFTPTVSGNRFGSVTITDNAASATQTISLSGSGNATPQASVSVASLGFGNQPVSSTSAAQTVTLTNTGDAPLSVAGVAATGDFAEANTCGSILLPSTACTISVTFTPTAAGTRNGTLTVTDNTGNIAGSTQNVLLSGAGQAVPVASLSSSTLTFAGQSIGATSAAQSVALNNTGTAPLIISNVVASGDFAQLNNCPASLAAGANCTINVTFTPTAFGNRFGSVTITDNAANSPQAITLTGTANATPQASVSVASLGFPIQPVSSTSAAQTVTLTNTGDAPLSVTGIAATGDFAQTGNCGSILSASAACSITVTFTPTAAGPRTGTLTITDNTGNVAGSTQTIPLSGIGQAVPVVSLSTNTLTFAGQSIGTTSAAQVITLSNTGSAALTISNVVASGDFAQLNNCPTSVPAGANCTINVTFTPTAAGNRFGSITFTDSAASSPQVITVSGTGNSTPQASVSTASLGFASQPIGTTSAVQLVTLTNAGAVPLSVTAIAATGDFAETNTCGSVLSAGTNCAISVTFTPTLTGPRNGTLTITDNSGSVVGTTQSVLLSGIGQAVPVASFSTNTLTFAGQSIGTTSAAQTVTLTNTGSAALIISNVVASGDFGQVNNCPASVAPAASCTINVTFTPIFAGNRFGSITLTDNAANSPQLISLSGAGNPTPQASISVASLGFAGEPIGVPSAAQSVTLTNIGAAPLSITGIAVNGDFSQVSTCGSILSPSTSCTVSVTFTPTAAGTRNGTLTITDNTGNVVGSTQTVALSGTGQAVPVVTLSTNTLTFTGQTVQTTSSAQTVSLTNTGSSPLVISNVTATGDFAQVNNCPASVAAAGSCTINVTFTPTAFGNRFGSVTVTDNAGNSPQVISISGTGTGAAFQISSLTATPAVPAGQLATYSLSVTSNVGFAQPVSLTCAAPATISCTVSPSIVTPSATATPAVTLTVSTELRTIAPPSSRIKIDPIDMLRHFNVTWLMWLLAALMILTVAFLRQRPMTASFGFAVVLLLISAACSAGGNAPGVPAGTPAGNYTITVTGTSGTTTVPVQVTLQVK